MTNHLQVGDRVANIGGTALGGVVGSKPTDDGTGEWVFDGDDGSVWTCSNMVDFAGEDGAAVGYAYGADLRQVAGSNT